MGSFFNGIILVFALFISEAQRLGVAYKLVEENKG